MGLLGSMTVRFGADTGGLASGIQRAKGLLGSLSAGDFAAPVVAGLGLIAGAAIGIGVSSIKAAGDFQQSLLKVQAYAGLTGDQVKGLHDQILSVSSSLGVSAQDMATALYPVISSGYTASQSLNILTLAAKTSVASGADMSVIADALTTSLKSMHAPASQAGQYMDMINKMTSLGKGNVSDYAGVIGKLSLAAGSAKVPFSDMGAALADLTTHGFPSVAQASTALGNLFTQIGPKVDTLAQHAKKLGISFDENKFKTLDLSGKLAYLQQVTDGNQGQILKLLGGSTLAQKAFNGLTGSTKDLTTNMQAMAHAGGATNDAYNTASQGFNASMGRMNNAGKNLQIVLGEKLLPVFGRIIDKISPLVGKFADWITNSHVVENTTTAVSNVVGKLATGATTLATNISNVVNFFKNNQVAGDALVGTLGGLVTVFIALNTSAIVGFIASIPAVIAGFVTWAFTAGAAAIATIAATWPLLLLGAVVALVITGIVLAIQHWGDIIKWIQGVWGNVTNWIGGRAHDLQVNFNKAIDGIKTFMSDTWNKIVDGVHSAMDKIKAGLDRAGGFIHDTFVAPFENAWHTISGIFGNIGAGISALASGNIPGALHDFGVPGFASGVRNFQGGLAIVGERGPEIVQLPQGSNVFPSVSSMSSSAASASGGGSSGAVPSSGDQHIYIELDGHTLAHVVGDRQAKQIRLKMGRRAA